MKSFSSRFLSLAAIAGCLVASLPIVSMAQGLPGLTIFSGVDRANLLNYRLDFDGRPGGIDRYRFRIPARKMNTAVSQFSITYPNTYHGEFDTHQVEIRVNGNDVAVEEVTWDQENRTIDIYPQTPVPADSRVELIFSNVHNPTNGGTHYFNALVQTPGDVPLLRYIGTWIISIGNNS